MLQRSLLVAAAVCVGGCGFPPVGGGVTTPPPPPPVGDGVTTTTAPPPPPAGGGTTTAPPPPPAGGGTTTAPPPPPVGGGTTTAPPPPPVGGGTTTAPPPPPDTPRTIFFDDFAGTAIDPAKWTVFDRLSDQANQEVNCVIPQNVGVGDGMLRIVSKHERWSCGDTNEPARQLDYTSGQIQQATPPFLYGTIDVRAKVPGGVGLWPCIWMLGFEWQASQADTANVGGHDWPRAGWSEVDIAEFMQGARSRVNTTVHYNSPGGIHEEALPFDATTRFMVYRLQWTPESLVWSVDAEDGKGFRELRTVTGSDGVPNVPMYLLIHTAIGGAGGAPDPATFPQTFEVDYARITQ